MTETKTKFYPPTNDVIFHCLFGTKGQEKTTKALLEGLLKKEVKELDLDRNLNLLRDYYDDKLEIADVRATDEDKNQYILEMQNSTNSFLAKRFLSYGCKAYIAELKSSDDYKKLNKVVIVILMMEKFPGLSKIEKYHTIWNFREAENPDIIITDDIEIHIFELQKYIKRKDKDNTVEPWLEFLVNPKGEEVRKAMKGYKTIQDAVDELNRLNADDEVRELAFYQDIARLDRNTALREAKEEGISLGIEQGIERGIKQGMKQQKIDIAKKMLKLDINKEIIMEATGLTKEEIEKIEI